MAELFGAIERGLGSALTAIYELTGSYAIAIIVLTIVVRVLLIPLTVKQIRSMKKMQEVGPQQKEIQRKYKERQAKAKDRTELQQIRLEMNRELQGLYRTAGVNPMGGCLPLLAQLPVFIAMFSIMRAAVPVFPQDVALADGGPVVEAFAGMELKDTICRPYDTITDSEKAPYSNGTPTTVRCIAPGAENEVLLEIANLEDSDGEEVDEAPWLSQCSPGLNDDQITLACRSALGTGHLPQDGELFRDLSVDGASIVGLSPGCSANEVGSDLGIRRCTSTQSEGDTAGAWPYYLLVALIAATSFYQTKQMQARASGQMADQQRMIGRIMPIMFAFISLSIPAGANTYFLVSNTWQIGQQHLMGRGQASPEKQNGGTSKAVAEKRPIESRPPRQKPSQQGKPAAKRAAQEQRKRQAKRRKRR